MRGSLKSNRILEGIVTALSILLLTGCMADMAQTDYASTEEGYEQKVAQNAIKQTLAATPPVTVNNPYALNSSLGAYASNNNPANIPVINNNASYGGLNAGMIQAGVFMQNTSPVYQAPTSFGSNTYSPTGR